MSGLELVLVMSGLELVLVMSGLELALVMSGLELVLVMSGLELVLVMSGLELVLVMSGLGLVLVMSGLQTLLGRNRATYYCKCYTTYSPNKADLLHTDTDNSPYPQCSHSKDSINYKLIALVQLLTTYSP